MDSDFTLWRGKVPGAGGCFHAALHAWLVHREQGWRVAIGVARASYITPYRHLHAWLEREDMCMSVVTGDEQPLFKFYDFVDIERDSVRLVNPRRMLRRHGISRECISALLNAWGEGKWCIVKGGVVPVGTHVP